MEFITYKNHTIKYMNQSGNTYIFHFGKYIKGFFGKGLIYGQKLAKSYVDAKETGR